MNETQEYKYHLPFPLSLDSALTIVDSRIGYYSNMTQEPLFDRQNHSGEPLEMSTAASVGYVADFILTTIIIPTLLPVLLYGISCRLWYFYNVSTKDNTCSLPLPPGSMGVPLVGETLNLIFGGSEFYQSRRTSYGNVYKTHILGRPTIRVIGAKNVRKVLMGEHTLVTSSWPTSTRLIMGEGALAHSVGDNHRLRRKVILKAFNHDALAKYVPSVHTVVRGAVQKWCRQGFVFGYQECKKLTFSIAAKVLLGFRINDVETAKMLTVFNEMVSNLFSLPVCVPGSGLYKGIKARDYLLDKIESCIKVKEETGSVTDFQDALDLIMARDTGDDNRLSRQEIKESALELLFAGHETTASASCSMILHLAKEPEVLEKVTHELAAHGLMGLEEPLTFEILNKLTYINNVVKEVLRILPPIGAGFRKALKTFELDGCQIPKGWTVAYSIRDTHETSEIFTESDKFNPDRWNSDATSERFHYLPFGGGSRACVGKEFAKIMLKLLLIELGRNCSWRLVNNSPTMKRLPVPHPTDGLPVEFIQNTPMRHRAFTF